MRRIISEAKLNSIINRSIKNVLNESEKSQKERMYAVNSMEKTLGENSIAMSDEPGKSLPGTIKDLLKKFIYYARYGLKDQIAIDATDYVNAYFNYIKHNGLITDNGGINWESAFFNHLNRDERRKSILSKLFEPYTEMENWAAKNLDNRIKDEKDAEIKRKNRQEEKEARKAEKERLQAEKEARKAERERIKAEKNKQK